LRAGGKAALAAALARLERDPDADETRTLLDAAYAAPRAHVVGLTGPPGVGKSSLLSALIEAWRRAGRTVGVIAVDPSSRRTGGALLGDRARLVTDPADDGVFVRSMAARDRLGGLAELTLAAMVVMRSLYDVVVIETVGVGQSETDVAGVADTVVFCVQPGSGDSLQFMKAGIVEIPHIVAVTKADLGALAERARADVAGALTLGEAGQEGWTPKVLAVSAQQRAGVAALLDAIDSHAGHLAEAGRLAQARHAQAQLWVEAAIRDRFGREGLRRAGDLSLIPGASPFARVAQAVSRLTAR
jgi:LAO/AO transport system kinase